MHVEFKEIHLLTFDGLWITTGEEVNFVFGFDQLLPYVLGVSIAGAFLSVLFLYARRYFPEGSVSAPRWVLRLQARESGMPYGLAIAASALWIYPQTAFFHGLAY